MKFSELSLMFVSAIFAVAQPPEEDHQAKPHFKPHFDTPVGRGGLPQRVKDLEVPQRVKDLEGEVQRLRAEFSTLMCFSSLDGPVWYQCAEAKANCCQEDGVHHEGPCLGFEGTVCFTSTQGACNGHSACRRDSAVCRPLTVMPGACNSKHACYEASGSVGLGSCTSFDGSESVCFKADAEIPPGLCTAAYACFNASQAVIDAAVADDVTCSTGEECCCHINCHIALYRDYCSSSNC